MPLVAGHKILILVKGKEAITRYIAVAAYAGFFVFIAQCTFNKIKILYIWQ